MQGKHLSPTPVLNPEGSIRNFEDFWLDYLVDQPPGARQIILRQDRFFEAYVLTGTLSAAARLANIVYGTAWDWQQKNTHHFRQRLAVAREQFADSLEKIGLDRLQTPAGNRGSDLLLLAFLNAHRPEKWRPNAVATDDTAKVLLARITELAKGNRKVRMSRTDTVEVSRAEEGGS